jgi:HD-GYP domain-containing protein (c-di-GMP phosphodiesterase class II)
MHHHENSLPRGAPTGVKKSAIHPMARLVTVADEFCYRILQNPDEPPKKPLQALKEMQAQCADGLDKKFFDALLTLVAQKPN